MLGAGLAGAGAGGLLFGGGSKYETTGQKVKRRLKNALIGGAMASGAAALLTHGAKQLATAMPADKETPLEAASKIPSSTPARLLYGAIGLEAGHAMNQIKTRDGINKLRGAINMSKDEYATSLLDKLPEATITNVSRARGDIQGVVDHLAASPDKLYEVLGKGKGPNDAATVKRITKLLNDAGVDTAKMKDALPGYLPFVDKRLSDLNLQKLDDKSFGTISWLKNKLSKVDAINNKIDTSSKTGKWLADKLTRIANKAEYGDLRNVNMDNKFFRSMLNPKNGRGRLAALATAGLLAPEIVSVGKNLYDLT